MLPFPVESYLWFSLVLIIALCRYASRLLLFKSIRGLQIDDWAMLLAVATYTTMIVTINIEVQHSSNLLPPGYDVSTLGPAEVKEREFGSKMVLIVEIAQCFCVWLVKGCILTLYNRVTVAYKSNIAIRVVAIYVAVGFVVMEVLYLGVWCRPFSDYWAVPSPNPQCTAATNHLITNAVFNISSDLAMIIIAVQIIVRSQLPMRKKLVLCGVFSLGVFVVISAVLNKTFSFNDPYGLAWTRWYVRESSTALLVANLPLTLNLFRRLVAHLPHSKHHNDSSSLPTTMPTPLSGRSADSRARSGDDEWIEALEGVVVDGETDPDRGTQGPKGSRAAGGRRPSWFTIMMREASITDSGFSGSSSQDTDASLTAQKEAARVVAWEGAGTTGPRKPSCCFVEVGSSGSDLSKF